jgi:hypothetical protein
MHLNLQYHQCKRATDFDAARCEHSGTRARLQAVRPPLGAMSSPSSGKLRVFKRASCCILVATRIQHEGQAFGGHRIRRLAIADTNETASAELHQRKVTEFHLCSYGQ